MEGDAIIPLTASGPATRDPALLLGVQITPSSDGGNATIYEGQDATSGRKLCRLYGHEEQTRQFRFARGIPCERGIFVDFTSHMDEVAIVYRSSPPIVP